MKSTDTTESVKSLSMNKERSISGEKCHPWLKKINRIYSPLQKPSSTVGDKICFSSIRIHSLKATEDKYEPVLIERCPVDLDKNCVSIYILKKIHAKYYAHFQ